MGIGVPELLLLLSIAVVVFGTKRLRNIGGDLGGAIKSFRRALSEEADGKEGEAVKRGDAAEQIAGRHE